MPPDGLYPAVGMHSEGEEVRINLEVERYDQSEVLMSIDNCDEEWARLHDIRVNGQVGEHTKCLNFDLTVENCDIYH